MTPTRNRRVLLAARPVGAEWLRHGELDRAPAAFTGTLQGKNVGEELVRLGEPGRR